MYIEPYENSQAFDLHDDAITRYDPGDLAPQGIDRDDDCERGSRKVVFEPFTGMKWTISNDIIVRVPMSPTSYLDREAQLVQHVTTLMEGTT